MPESKPAVKRPAKRAPAAVAAVVQQIEAGSGWYDQNSSPLGKRKHLSLCRDGVLPCRKDGKQRLVRRADVDAYIMRNDKALASTSPDEIDRELDALGMGKP